ncbi:protein kinase [Nocardia sp. NPDC059240]|uniref:serine/threonine-protein kinase n=1 Tax=Nocardia sp. NPDC059240 TaxID=3346786 RepID=UPI00368E5E2B
MGDGYLGRYRLDELLGSGGSSEVWRAHDTVADRTVALKVLAPVLTADPEYRRRFEREARAATLLHGPHIMAVHAHGELEGRLFIDTEFVDGLDVEAMLEWEGPMAPAAAVDLITQIAEALDEAHAAGLIHRDVKPQNIIVAPDDVAYLIDFGTAQQDGQRAITQTGMLVGTPAYMAPERFEGTATPRSDIYALACVLFECLTGQRPFAMRNPAQLMRAHLERTPPAPSTLVAAIPATLDQVIARGLAKDPAERHSSAGEFAAAARAALVAVGADEDLGAPERLGTSALPDGDTTVVITGPNRYRPGATAPDARTVAMPRLTGPGDALTGKPWTRRAVITTASLAGAAVIVAMLATWLTGRAVETPGHADTPATKITAPESISPTSRFEQPPPVATTEPPATPEAVVTPDEPAWTEPAQPVGPPGPGKRPKNPGGPGDDRRGDHPGRPRHP